MNGDEGILLLRDFGIGIDLGLKELLLSWLVLGVLEEVLVLDDGLGRIKMFLYLLVLTEIAPSFKELDE